MAKIQFSNIIVSVSGKMGNIVIRRSSSGDHYICRAPDRPRVKASEAQNAQRQRFKEATDYAKAAVAHPTVGPIYREAALKANKQPYALAVSDYFEGINLLEK
jgi:hypothetical protein